jgi:hypothetical protein
LLIDTCTLSDNAALVVTLLAFLLSDDAAKRNVGAIIERVGNGTGFELERMPSKQQRQ